MTTQPKHSSHLTTEEKYLILDKILAVNNLQRGDDMNCPVSVTVNEDQTVTAYSVKITEYVDDFVINQKGERTFLHFYQFVDSVFPKLYVGDIITEIDPVTFLPKVVVVDEELIKQRSGFVMRFGLSNSKYLFKSTT